MRFVILVIGLILHAIPATSQAVDPKSVAAIEAAGAGWEQAFALAQQADPVTSDVLHWMRLLEGKGSFTQYLAFLERRPDWPGLDRLRAQAEEVIAKGHDPAEVIAWFAKDAPQTGVGALRLAEALTTTGQIKQAQAALRSAWLALGLTDAVMSGFS